MIWLICFNVSWLISGIIILVRRNRLKSKMDQSISWVASLGSSIAINGKKGSGKTTSGAGIVHYLTIIINSKLMKIMEDNRKILKGIDFNHIEKLFIDKLYEFENYYEAESFVIQYLYGIKNNDINEFYLDFLSLEDKEKLLKQYLEAFFILNIRKHYVYSKGYFFNRIMIENANLLDPSSIEMRNVLDKLNWQLDIGNIVFDDERSMDAGNVDSNKRVVKLSGSKEFSALLRNMFRELTYRVVIKQVSTDEIKLERDLIDSNLFIVNRKVIGSFKLFRLLIEVFLLLCFVPFRFYFFFRYMFSKQYNDYFREVYLKKVTRLRKLENKCFQLCNFLNSFGYIKTYFLNYYNADDVGKRNPDLYEKFICYFPISYCYGVVDTYEYNCLLPFFKSLNKNSINLPVNKFYPGNRVYEYVKKLKERSI